MNIKYLVNLGYDFYPCAEIEETEYISVPICRPEMESDEVGSVSVVVIESVSEAPDVNISELVAGPPRMKVSSTP